MLWRGRIVLQELQGGRCLIDTLESSQSHMKFRKAVVLQILRGVRSLIGTLGRPQSYRYSGESVVSQVLQGGRSLLDTLGRLNSCYSPRISHMVFQILRGARQSYRYSGEQLFLHGLAEAVYSYRYSGEQSCFPAWQRLYILIETQGSSCSWPGKGRSVV